ncbi:MAG: phage tail protein [Clostridium sp.]
MKKGVYSEQQHPFYLVGEQIDSMAIEVYGNDGRTVMKTYTLKNLVVAKWEVSAMQAQSNEILIDTFTLAYGELYVLS